MLSACAAAGTRDKNPACFQLHTAGWTYKSICLLKATYKPAMAGMLVADCRHLLNSCLHHDAPDHAGKLKHHVNSLEPIHAACSPYEGGR